MDKTPSLALRLAELSEHPGGATMKNTNIEITAELLKVGITVRMEYLCIGSIGYFPAGQKHLARHIGVLTKDDMRRKTAHGLKRGTSIGGKRVREKRSFNPQAFPIGQRRDITLIGVIKQPCMGLDQSRMRTGQLSPIDSPHMRIIKSRNQSSNGMIVGKQRILSQEKDDLGIRTEFDSALACPAMIKFGFGDGFDRKSGLKRNSDCAILRAGVDHQNLCGIRLRNNFLSDLIPASSRI